MVSFLIFGAFTYDGCLIYGGWKRIDRMSGKLHISLILAHPMIGPRKVYAYRGRATGKPKTLLQPLEPGRIVSAQMTVLFGLIIGGVLVIFGLSLM